MIYEHKSKYFSTISNQLIKIFQKLLVSIIDGINMILLLTHFIDFAFFFLIVPLNNKQDFEYFFICREAILSKNSYKNV